MTLQLPAYLQNRQPPGQGKFAAGLGTPVPAYVSLKDDRFTLLGDDGLPSRTVPPSLTLDFVAVGSAPTASRTFYDGAYDAESAAAPACYSDDAITPSPNAQNPQSSHCANCPKAEWGKLSPNGNKIPWCSTRKKLAVIVPAAGPKVYLLSIPPGSLKPWRAYVQHVESMGTMVPYVITRMAMKDKELSFDPVDHVPENVANAVDQIAVEKAVEIAQIVGDIAALPKSNVVALPPRQPTPALAPPPAANELAGAFGVSREPPPPAKEPEEPKRRTRAARSNETVVGPGAIPPATFTAANDEEAEMEAKLAAIRAKKAGQAAVATAVAPSPPAPGAFIGAGQTNTAAFGIAPNAPPPPNAVNDMLNAAFGLPT